MTSFSFGIWNFVIKFGFFVVTCSLIRPIRTDNGTLPDAFLVIYATVDTKDCTNPTWDTVKSIVENRTLNERTSLTANVPRMCACTVAESKCYDHPIKKARQCIFYKIPTIYNSINATLEKMNTESLNYSEQNFICGHASYVSKGSKEYETFQNLVENNVHTSTLSNQITSSRTGGLSPSTTEVFGHQPDASAQKSTGGDGSPGSDKAAIGGAVGGSLAGLAALSTLAWFLYRQFRKNKVDDDGSSFNDVAPIIPPGGVQFPEAPNSVAPAGT